MTLVRPVGVGGPLGVDLVVDRDERRLAANGEPDVTGGQPLVDAGAQRADGAPRGLGVGQRDPRVLVHAGDDVGEVQRRLARLGRTGDRRRGLRMRGGRQRNVALAGEQPRRRVQPDPSGAGDVHLGPGVQVGEVGGRPGRTVERLHIGGQLHQVAGHEARRQAHLAQDRHEQPRRVAARPDPGAQRVIRCLHTGFHPHVVADVGIHRTVERDQEVDGARAGCDREVLHPGLGEVTGARALAFLVHRAQIGLEVFGQRLGVFEADMFGPVLDEEVERVDDLHVGDQADGDGQAARPGREDQPRHEVAESVLLPVDEVVAGLDLQRVGLDRGARVRSRAQPHDMRIHLHQPIERVAGAMLQRHLDAHAADPITTGEHPHRARSRPKSAPSAVSTCRGAAAPAPARPPR